MSSSHEIPNEHLKPEHLPKSEDDQLVWISFALTFNGYAERGSHEACAAFANAVRQRWEEDGTLPSGLSDLRTALFYEQRRWRWSNEAPFTEKEWCYWKSLIDAIRIELLRRDKLAAPLLQPPDARPSINDTEDATAKPSPEERTIDLFSDADAHGGSRHAWLRLTKNGELILQGQDLGGAVRGLLGTSEYEWAWSLDPSNLAGFLESLGIQAYSSADLLEAIAGAIKNLDQAEVQKLFKDMGATFWNRIGD